MYLFTLVHGTKLLGPLEGKSKWTALDSLLSATLLNTFPDSRITTVSWSGWNSLWARRRAVDTLRRHIQTVAQEKPEVDHVIIAHSHGGNVALAALSDSPAVAGLACMGTPFLQFRKRQGIVGPLARNAILTGSKFLAAVAGFGLILLIAMSSRWAMYTLVALFPVFMAARTRLVRRFDKVLTSCRQSIAQSLASTWSYLLTTSTYQGQLLIIRVAGDEASGLLASSQILGWISHWTITKALFVLAKVVFLLSLFKSKRHLFFLFVAYVIASVTFGVFWPENHSRVAYFLTHLPMYVNSGMFFGLFVLYLLPFIAIIVSAIAALPYGIDALLISISYEITAESTPIGSWQIDIFPPDEDPSTRMAHTAIYNNPAVIARITEWVKGATRPSQAG